MSGRVRRVKVTRGPLDPVTGAVIPGDDDNCDAEQQLATLRAALKWVSEVTPKRDLGGLLFRIAETEWEAMKAALAATETVHLEDRT